MKMYVEDFITAIPLAMEDAVLSTFNVYNASLQFTIELEINGKLPFLDILLVRKRLGGTISTEWYMKPTSSGRILNYYSDHYYNQKINMAFGLIQLVGSRQTLVGC